MAKRDISGALDAYAGELEKEDGKPSAAPRRRHHPTDGQLHDEDQRSTIIVNRALWKRFKIYCVRNDKTYKEAIDEALRSYLRAHGEEA